jgi:hypothetical protein
MIEKNRDILSDAIKKMPVRKASPSNWEGISHGLDQANADALISENISGLPLHKAPAGSWNRIAASLPYTSLTFFQSLWGKLIISTIIIGGLTLTYLLTRNNAEESTRVTDQVSFSSTVSETNHSGTQMDQAEENSPVIASEEIKVELTPLSSSGEDNIEVIFAEPPVFKNDDISASMPGLSRIDRKEAGPFLVREEQNISFKTSIKAPEKKLQIDYARSASRFKIKAGVFVAYKNYQDIQHPDMTIPQKMLSAGIDLSLEKQKLILQAGIEYLSWEEQGNYIIDYRQNQLVYQYNYVDSTFIDPYNGRVTYFTTEKGVYDSVPGTLNDETAYRYKVLQFPVMIGYKFLDRGNFSAGILGGLGFDIRLSGKQFVPVFSLDESSVTEVNNKLEYRVFNNWRLLLAMDLGYHFAKNWELYAEPGYQWYMKPLYTPQDTKGVGLFNIKLGLRVSF